MDNIEFSKIVEALADLPKHFQDFLLFLLGVLVVAVKQVTQIAAVAVFSDDVEVASVLG